MHADGSPDLAQVLGDPQRAGELRPDEIPALLGALEHVRAALWAQMVRAAGPVKREADGAGEHDLLTVPEVAAELRFTRGYVYEAVRRGELPAVRKGKYVRLRRGDLAAWLGGQRAASLDGTGRLPHSAVSRRGSPATDSESKRARRKRPGQMAPRSRAMASGPRGKQTRQEPGSM